MAYLKYMIVIISIPKTIMYFLTAFITIYERSQLLKEIKLSPLSIIDETLTEDLYKNIISQSKDPDNPKLKEEYKILKENSILKAKKINSHTNITKSFAASDGSTILGVNKYTESINNGGVKDTYKLTRKYSN